MSTSGQTNAALQLGLGDERRAAGISGIIDGRSRIEMLRVEEDARVTGINQLDFRRLIESNADGMLVVDLAGTVLYANPAAADILGYPVGELLQVALGRPVASGETTDIVVHRPGKKPADVEMRVVEITWDERLALLASLRDVSAQRAHDARQRQAQKLEAIGRLAAGIIHDFKNLIATFEGGLRLLQRQLAKDPNDPRVGALMDEMLRRTQNANALTLQLLAFSRQQSLKPEAIDLSERVRSLIKLLEQVLGNGIAIVAELDPALAPIFADPNQLDVAMINLALNARQAMAGKGTLTIEAENAPSDFNEAADKASLFVRITVRDTGCGMTKEVLAQVFEPFFTTKSDGEGTGLGLSQVYGFVKQSGGHIRIDSEVGSGTSVHLFLPRARHAGLGSEAGREGS